MLERGSGLSFGAKEVISMNVKTDVKAGGVLVGD
jgi:hypothetical protein